MTESLEIFYMPQLQHQEEGGGLSDKGWDMSNKNVFGHFDSLKQNGFLSTLGPLYVLVQDSKGKVLVFSRWQKKLQFTENWCYQTHCDLIQIKVTGLEL